jgi:hypothetical protein
MKGAFLTAAVAALLVAAPALAQEVTIEKKETTITREVPESGSTVSTVVVAPNPPPELRVETPPPPPGPAMVWVGGNWRWNPETRDYVWAAGRYAEPPRPRAAWVPGHWVQRPDGWVFVDGRWD